MTRIVNNILDCKVNHVIKLIKPIKTSDNENIYLIDREVLFKLHQWNVVVSTKISKGKDCEIEFYEYSPFIYNNLVRKYKFKRVLFIERDSHFIINVEFDEVNLILELDPNKVCPVYEPPKKKKRKKKRTKY